MGVISKAMSMFILKAHVLQQISCHWKCSIIPPQISHFCHHCTSINILLQHTGNSMEKNFLVSWTALWPTGSCASISLTGTLQSTLISTFNILLVTSHGSNFWTTTVRQTSDVHVAITMPYAAGTQVCISTLMTKLINQVCHNVFLLYEKFNTSTLTK